MTRCPDTSPTVLLLAVTILTAVWSWTGAAPEAAATVRLSAVAATGYWETAADGGIFSFGSAPFLGSMAAHPLNAPIVGMASIPGGSAGYYEVAADGGMFGFGVARFFGSMGGDRLNAPIVGMALGPDITGGYYEVASDGGVFAFGDAPFLGSMAGKHLDAPIVGMALAETGAQPGYYLVGADGGVFAFGSAPFLGSEVTSRGTTAIAGTVSGRGYVLLNESGNVDYFGDASVGAPSPLAISGNVVLNAPAIALKLTNANEGRWVVSTDGGIFAYGGANYLGSMGGRQLNAPVVGFGISP